MESEIRVLDHGFVRLDDCLADDLSVVNSARVSFAKRSDYERGPGIYGYSLSLKEEDAGLIRYLMKNRHGTPFEHNIFRFHIKCPIFVAREWQRHRIGSYNEWSARYSKLEPEFYIPQNWRTQVGKPGAYTFEPLDEELIHKWEPVILAHSKYAFSTYEAMINDGVAKEIARIVLPFNIYTQYYWTLNARSLMNFLSLRNSDHAMWEIREYARVVEEIFKSKMPETASAFIENERIAP